LSNRTMAAVFCQKNIYNMFTIFIKNMIYYSQKAEGVKNTDAMEVSVDDPTVDL